MAILGGIVYPGGIQRYQVSPNEIAKEKPYIDFNIRYTRGALLRVLIRILVRDAR